MTPISVIRRYLDPAEALGEVRRGPEGPLRTSKRCFRSGLEDLSRIPVDRGCLGDAVQIIGGLVLGHTGCSSRSEQALRSVRGGW